MTIFGLLCVFVISFLLIASVVGSVVVISSLADQRVWHGVLKAGRMLLPVAVIAMVLMLFFGLSITTERVQEPATAIRFEEPMATSTGGAIPSHHGVSIHGDLVTSSTPVLAPEVALSSQDPGPADALIPVIVAKEEAKSVVNDLTPVTRPSWVPAKIEKTVTQQGETKIIVLPSSLFATEHEAETALDAQVQSLVSEDFLSVVRSRWLRPREMSWVNHLAHSVVTDRYVEVETRDLGAVTAPMYRVWMRLELSPQTRAQFFNTYRAQMQKSRLMVASGLVLALLAVPFAVLIGTRGARWTHGRGKPFWKLSAVATVLLIWAAGVAWVNHCVVLF